MNKAGSKTECGCGGQATKRTRVFLIWLMAFCYSACPVLADPVAGEVEPVPETVGDSEALSPEQAGVHWFVLASGGGQGNAGGYLLRATVGQPCVGRTAVGSISLITGFWQDFESGDQECCGRYTGGETGNTDCDIEGQRSLSDITILISNIYITHNPLCCEANGNTDGDPENLLSLTDIMRLIDNVYINHTLCAPCP
jgi:hypothetical protein